MRLKSLYNFYQFHFDYQRANPSQSLSYGMIIRDFMKVLRRIYEMKSLSPLYEYEQDAYALLRTVEFLHNLQELAEARFPEPLKTLEYYQHEIEVDPTRLILHRKKGLQIRAEFIWNPHDEEIIFLTFSNSDNMVQELGVFLTLSEELSIQPLPVTEPKLYTYWSVPNGLEYTIARNKIMRVPVYEVLATCNRILSSRHVK